MLFGRVSDVPGVDLNMLLNWAYCVLAKRGGTEEFLQEIWCHFSHRHFTMEDSAMTVDYVKPEEVNGPK